MRLHWSILWVAAAAVFASCSGPKRTFAPAESGGTGAVSTASGGESLGGTGNAAGDAGTGEAAAPGVGGDGVGGEVSCAPDERRCNGDVPEACGTDGTFEATRARCAFGCLDGGCTACREGAKACEDAQAKECVDGQWQFTPCDSQCEAGECVDACTEGARQCNGLSTVEVCTDGAFVDDTDCPGLCLDGECSGECRPDSTRCGASVSAREVCSADGTWTRAACAGATPVCLEGACVACTPDESQCSPEGRPQHCTSFGTWEDQPPCSGDAPACVDGSCQTCNPGSRRCNAGLPQQCNDSGTAWVDGDACTGSTPVCVADSGECGTCHEGDRQCGDASTPQVCDASGRWVDEPSCTGDAPNCIAGSCVECIPKSARCDNNNPELCDDSGSWITGETCEGSTPYCIEATGTCGCKENDVSCIDANTPATCSAAGSWVARADCSGDTPVCDGGACVCVEDSQECTSASTARRCKNGVWEETTCDNSTPVCVAGDCKECTPGTTRCTSDGSHVVEACTDDGVWKESEQCSDFCSRGSCLNPAAEGGVVGCDAPTGLLCKGRMCCYAADGKSSCQDSTLKCPTRTVPIHCDGPTDCGKDTPICCALSSATACVATLTDCSGGVVVCDPETPACPKGTVCTRATPNLFTCDSGPIRL